MGQPKTVKWLYIRETRNYKLSAKIAIINPYPIPGPPYAYVFAMRLCCFVSLCYSLSSGDPRLALNTAEEMGLLVVPRVQEALCTRACALRTLSNLHVHKH